MRQIDDAVPVLEVKGLKVEFNCKSHIVHAVNVLALRLCPARYRLLLEKAAAANQ